MTTSVATQWENTFAKWAKPPGQTEQQRCETAESSVRRAIQRSTRLQDRNIKVFTQGSYRNRVNVRKDSDVDVGILCYDVFFYQLPPQTTSADFEIGPASYSYVEFKNDVQQALVDYFGPQSVTRGNKALTVRENSYHVDADVAPFFEHRRYLAGRSYESGVELRADNGLQVINWPEQHYDNGVSKNSDTHRRYKALVRILKSLRNAMNDDGIAATEPIPGFLSECLIWNVPTSEFGCAQYTDDLQNCLAFLFKNTRTDNDECHDWGEVSELKYLFRGPQKWTRQQAHNFLVAAWGYVGFA